MRANMNYQMKEKIVKDYVYKQAVLFVNETDSIDFCIINITQENISKIYDQILEESI